jgi:cytochrome c
VTRPQFRWAVAGLLFAAALLTAFYVVRGAQAIPVAAAYQVPGGDPAAGARLLAAYGCGSCHEIRGVTLARGKVGPPLTNIRERSYLAGRLPNIPDNMIRWIRDPQTYSPGTAMPNLGVTEGDARHMAAYLYAIR